MQLTIRSDARRQPEKTYIFKVLFDVFLGVPYQVLWQEGLTETQVILPENGHILRFPDTFFPENPTTDFQAVSEILENARVEHPFQPGKMLPMIAGRGQFRMSDTETDCPVDLFAAPFFMLSRWEEIVQTERDAHGRFPVHAAHAHRHQYLDRPLVDEYTELLWQLLLRAGYTRPRRVRQFRMAPSHDVDHPRLWWRPAARLRTLAGSLLRRYSLKETAFWLQQLHTDPFDTFDELMDLSEQAGVRSQFNFMGARAPQSDCYYPLEHPFTRQLIQKIQDRGHLIGFHPSYESVGNAAQFGRELASLQALSAEKIRAGRQHYLRFTTPDTWRCWAAHGLEADSTLGYPEMPGFRCGTCHAFPVFDVVARQVLPLQEIPLIAMDVTLALYLHWTPEQAEAALLQLKQTVRQHGGIFALLWHNSSLKDYFWRPWAPVYRRVLLG